MFGFFLSVLETPFGNTSGMSESVSIIIFGKFCYHSCSAVERNSNLALLAIFAAPFQFHLCKCSICVESCCKLFSLAFKSDREVRNFKFKSVVLKKLTMIYIEKNK